MQENIFQFVEMDETTAAQFPWTQRLVRVFFSFFDWTFKVAQTQNSIENINWAQFKQFIFLFFKFLDSSLLSQLTFLQACLQVHGCSGAVHLEDAFFILLISLST